MITKSYYLLRTKYLATGRCLHSESEVKRIAIIGAGVAGLQACKVLKGAGYDCTIFERASEVGGVWRDNYANMTVQVPRDLYEFPDYEMKTVPSNSLAKCSEVQSNIKQFCSVMNLSDSLLLNTIVKNIKKSSADGWDLSYSTSSGEEKTSSYDYVVVSTGMYSSHLNVPKYKGVEDFVSSGGEILHSSQCNSTKVSSFKDKNVIVVGSAKSAEDVAAAAVTIGEASTSTLLYRRAHWGTPLHIAGIIPFQYVFLSRLGQSLVEMYKGVWPGISSTQETLHKILAPVMYPVFKIVETLFAFQLKQYGPWKPDLDVVEDFYGYGHLPTKTFINCVQTGKVRLVKDEIETLTSDKGDEKKRATTRSIQLKSGKSVPCDVLVLGTGFTKSYDIFDTSIREALDVQSDGLYLYRHIIPPNIKNLAFCGSEIATISNIATYAIQAEWIKKVIKKEILLPSVTEMKKDINYMKEWKRSWMPETPSRASLVLLHQIHYHDSLLHDMKLKPYRKSFFLSEIFMPYKPSDYRNIFV